MAGRASGRPDHDLGDMPTRDKADDDDDDMSDTSSYASTSTDEASSSDSSSDASSSGPKRKKTKDYPEFATAERCRLVVAGMEVGGRWSEEGYELLENLARAKAQEAPRALRGSAYHAYLRRWVALLSFSAQDSLAETLVHGTAQKTELWNDWAAPLLSQVLNDTHEGPDYSRLPPLTKDEKSRAKGELYPAEIEQKRQSVRLP